MAQPSMSVRIAANLAELRKNMAEGRDQIEATRAGFQKLATSFQGDKLIQQAHNVAAAVHEVGGASNLTEREQARVNRTVEAALEKYRLLGKEAPQALRELAVQTKQAEEKTSLLTSGMRLLVGVFSARALLTAASDAIAFGGKMSDLASKSGMTAEALQRMAFAAGQSGVPVERLADGVVQLSKRLVDGDKSAVEGVKALGLNVDALIASGPERAFYAIGDAIAGVPSPMQQAAIAVGLLGRTGADFLPAFKTDMQGVADSAQRAGRVLSEDTINALDRADDSFAALKLSVTVLMGQALEPLIPGITIIAEWLGENLPKALRWSRDGINDLIKKGMELNVWLADTAASVTETVASVPILGRVFGQTSGDVEYFKQRAQEARDQLAMFTADGAKPATEAVKAAAQPTKDYGQALRDLGAAGQQAGVDLGAMHGPSVEFLNLESRSLQETAKLTVALEKWAQVNGAVLAPSIRQVSAALSEQTPLIATANTQWIGFAGTVQQQSAAADASTGGFFANLKGFFGGEGSGGKMSQMLNQIGPQFAAAFINGPGSAGDKMKAFATQAAGTLMGMIPGVGPWLQAFSGPIVEGLTKLASKAKDILSGIFGGPSATEKQQRSLVAEFEKDLAAGLTATQKLEAGGESWKQTVIAVRDAYLAQGRSAEEAEADVKRLWESSKQGAGATAAVMAEIKRKMDEAAAAGEEMADRTAAASEEMAGRVTSAVNGIPRHVEIAIEGRYRQEEIEAVAPEGFVSGSDGIRDFGRGTLAVLHGREEVRTESQKLRDESGGSSMAASLDALRDAIEYKLPLSIRDAMLQAAR